jgi:hypothetical protein
MKACPTSSGAEYRALRKWIYAAASIFLLVYAVTFALRARGSASAQRTVETVYEQVKLGNYNTLGRDHLATASAIKTLQEAERLHGKLKSWKRLRSETHVLGRPTQVDLLVDRNGREFVDVLALGDSVHLHIVMELEFEDYKLGHYEKAIRVIAKPPDPNRP